MQNGAASSVAELSIVKVSIIDLENMKDINSTAKCNSIDRKTGTILLITPIL